MKLPIGLACVFLYLVSFGQQAFAQNGNLSWGREFASNGSAWTTRTDASGNVIAIGAFSGTADFDFGTGEHVLTAFGQEDLFVVKLSPQGTFIWAKQIGGSGTSLLGFTSLVVDADGYIYIDAPLAGAIDVDPGPGVQTLTGTGYFILKLSPNGDYEWSAPFVSNDPFTIFSLAVDNAGNVLATGSFIGTCDFDPSVGTSTLTSASLVDHDAFVVKFNADGDFAWVKQFSVDGAVNSQLHPAVLLATTDGYLYLAGYFIGTVDFDPGAGTNNALGSFDGFILKLTADGNFVWMKQMNGTASTAFRCQSGVLNAQNQICIAGSFETSADFDPNGGTQELFSNGNTDFFVARYDTGGNLIWARNYGKNGYDLIPIYVGTDGDGNIYTAGSFQTYDAPIDLDPGPDDQIVSLKGLCDTYILKLDANGNFVWHRQFADVPSTEWFQAWDVHVDLSGNIYLAGVTTGGLDIDPGPGYYIAPDTGAFVIKVGECSVTYSSLDLSGPGPFEVNGITYSSAGLYVQFITNVNGCDSVLNLTVGMEDVESPSPLFVTYPNPASNNICIRFDLTVSCEVEIRDQYGRLVSHSALRAVQHECLNADLASGMYQVVVKNGHTFRTSTIAVLK